MLWFLNAHRTIGTHQHKLLIALYSPIRTQRCDVGGGGGGGGNAGLGSARPTVWESGFRLACSSICISPPLWGLCELSVHTAVHLERRSAARVARFRPSRESHRLAEQPADAGGRPACAGRERHGRA